MMWDWYDGWNWLWMSAFMLVFWAAVFVMVVWVASVLSGDRRTHDRAIETLRRRLAAGEITQDEYDKTRRILQG